MAKPIQLTSGRKVHLESLHIEPTYAGLLEGSPDAATNASIMKRATSRMDLVWGHRRTVVIEPKIESYDFDDKRHPRLPACLYTAWLISESVSRMSCGSELVVVWFGPWEFDTGLGNSIQEAVKDVAWEANARDFDY